MDGASMSKHLFTAHKAALTTLYSELDQSAAGLGELSVGTAGSVLERTNATGTRFYAHQYYDAEGKKRERYIAGPIGDRAADQRAADVRDRVAASKELAKSARLLVREGYYLADSRTYATLAALHNHGLFAAGAVLLGSHAYGVLLNHLGVRAAVYETRDVDIGRNDPLVLQSELKEGILGALTTSDVRLVEAPRLNVREPSTSFMKPGAPPFQVDLLTPVRKSQKPFLPVSIPELKAHATGLPYLDYLLAETQFAIVIAREGVCRVRVPVPERMAWHKLLVSVLRATQSPKSRKDFEQGCVLLAVVGELDGEALLEAAGKLPAAARAKIFKQAALIEKMLEAHPRALEVWQSLKKSDQ
ncbi:MAG: nucleotidyltransferase domain-containing protein [Burkholderiales bacterium]|nr:nucleotidyltransferase domain-containing protein [Burkholderiales bacterium]